MEWLTQNWLWLLIAAVLVAISIAVTQYVETRRYRVRLVISLLLLEFWVCLVTRAHTLFELLALGILGGLLLRLCTPAISHILAQQMADKATDALFGEREPSPPTLDRAAIKLLRKQSRPQEAVKALETVIQGSPDDFESRLLLASIYAEDLYDLPAAEREIGKLIAARTISPSIQEMARQKLAEWKAYYLGEQEPKRQVVVKPAPTAEFMELAKTPNALIPDDAFDALAPVMVAPIDTTIVNYQTVEDLCQRGNYGSAVSMIDQMVAARNNDYKAWAIKAWICVHFLKQPALADSAMRQLLAAQDLDSEQAEAVDKLAEAFTAAKDDAVKAGRLWRKLLEMPSVPVEQKIVVQTRLKKWQTAMAG